MIEEKLQTLCVEMIKSIEHAVALTDSYINSFSKEDFYTFSDSNSRLQHYKNAYSDFVRTLACPLNDLEAQNSQISSLLILADSEMKIDIISYLQDIFEEYLRFEKSLSEYGSNVKIIFARADASASALVEQTQKFKFSLLSLLEKTKKGLR